MDKFAKAIGAAQGGVTAAAGITAMAAAAIAMMPPNVAAGMPWWGYLAIFMAAAVVCVLFPVLGAYLAPANTPQSLPAKIDVPVNVPVNLTDDGKGGITATTGPAQ